MKTTTLILALLGCFFSQGCGTEDVGDDTGNQPATLEANVDLSSYATCSLDTPCSNGLSCLYLDLVDGDSPALCIGVEEACDLVDCGPSECLILESYPGVVTCGGGTCSGDDCDDPVSSVDGGTEP